MLKQTLGSTKMLIILRQCRKKLLHLQLYGYLVCITTNWNSHSVSESLEINFSKINLPISWHHYKVLPPVAVIHIYVFITFNVVASQWLPYYELHDSQSKKLCSHEESDKIKLLTIASLAYQRLTERKEGRKKHKNE